MRDAERTATVMFESLSLRLTVAIKSSVKMMTGTSMMMSKPVGSGVIIVKEFARCDVSPASGVCALGGNDLFDDAARVGKS